MQKLKDLKLGDPVAIVIEHGWSRDQIELKKGQVERVTATQIVALGGRRFMKSTGCERGNSGGRWSSGPVLQPLTQDLLDQEAQCRKERAARKKCDQWRKRLDRASGDDAIMLAAMLPDLPSDET